MIGVLALAAAMAQSAPVVPDQTSDVALVARFLDVLKTGDENAAASMLSAKVFIGDYFQKSPTDLRAFRSYVAACKMSRISAVASSRIKDRMPLGATWGCAYPEADRAASFWFEGSKISRIGFGPPPIIEMPPLKGRR